MSKIRTTEEICLLCKINKSDKKGSHYTPAGITKRVIGERDKEELYTICSHEAETSTYYGRSNLSNKDPEIRKPPHVDDYIFCTECEKRLGIIESECNNPLIVLTDALAAGKLTISKTKNGNKYYSFSSPNRNIIIIYFYSIIWRQCLQQELEIGSVFISKVFQEQLREIIHTEISKPIMEIEKSKDFENYPPLIILTTYHKGDSTTNFITPHPTPSNPQLFFIGTYINLIKHSEQASVKTKTGFPSTLLEKDLVINFWHEGLIGIVNEGVWNNVITKLAKLETEKFLHNMATRLSIAKRLPYEDSRWQLHLCAENLKSKYPNNYVKCLQLSLEHLLR